jgi:hypothetical protein
MGDDEAPGMGTGTTYGWRSPLLLALLLLMSGCDGCGVWVRNRRQQIRIALEQNCESAADCGGLVCRQGPVCMRYGVGTSRAVCECWERHLPPCMTAADCPTGPGEPAKKCTHYPRSVTGSCEYK